MDVIPLSWCVCISCGFYTLLASDRNLYRCRARNYITPPRISVAEMYAEWSAVDADEKSDYTLAWPAAMRAAVSPLLIRRWVAAMCLKLIVVVCCVIWFGKCNEHGDALSPTVNADYCPWPFPVTPVRWLQLRFDFDLTGVRLLIKGHSRSQWRILI